MTNPPTPPAVVFLPTGEYRKACHDEWWMSGEDDELLRGPSAYEWPVFARYILTPDQAARVRAIVEDKQ